MYFCVCWFFFVTRLATLLLFMFCCCLFVCCCSGCGECCGGTVWDWWRIPNCCCHDGNQLTNDKQTADSTQWMHRVSTTYYWFWFHTLSVSQWDFFDTFQLVKCLFIKFNAWMILLQLWYLQVGTDLYSWFPGTVHSQRWSRGSEVLNFNKRGMGKGVKSLGYDSKPIESCNTLLAHVYSEWNPEYITFDSV